MYQPPRRELGLRERVRLIVALVVLAGFAAISAVGIGVTLHGRSETLDSLEHWQVRLEEETGAPETPKHAIGLDSPSSRIRRLDAELDAVPGRLLALGSVFVLASVLVILGFKALRSSRRIP